MPIPAIDGVERHAVTSSNLATIGFLKGTLAVQFNSGHVYHYFDVAAEDAVAFDRSESKGRYFAQKIKGIYSGRKVTGDCNKCGDIGVLGCKCDDCGDGTYREKESRYADPHD